MRAFVIDEEHGRLRTDVRERSLGALDENDVVVRVEYSGLNYKDAMVASAPSRVRRVSQLVGGVDAAGVVEVSTSEEVRVGDRVAVYGGDLGVARDGGFATQVRAPARFVSVLPDALSTREAMIIGTAGVTAMASVLALEDRGLASGARVLVTGATGGVGSQSVAYLAAKGYEPVASTGSPESAPWLIERGAVRVIGRDEVSDRPDRVLGSELWDGAIDCVGGETLASILRSLRYGAGVAASGLVASADLMTTVYPFITRGVALLGIDAVYASPLARSRVWAALGDIVRRLDLAPLVDREIGLSNIGAALEDVRRGTTRGRILVSLANNA